MAYRGENSPQQRHSDRHRKVSPANQKGDKGVTTAFHRAKAHNGRRSENQTIQFGVVTAVASNHEHTQDRSEFLDQTNYKRRMGNKRPRIAPSFTSDSATPF